MPPTELWTAKSFLKEFCSQNSVRTDKPSSHSSSGFQHQMALMLCRTQKELLGSCSTFSGMFPSIPVQASTYSEFCCQLIQRQGMFSISYTQLSLSSCMYTHITGKEQGITRVQAQTLSFSLEINKTVFGVRENRALSWSIPCSISQEQRQGQKNIRSQREHLF